MGRLLDVMKSIEHAILYTSIQRPNRHVDSNLLVSTKLNKSRILLNSKSYFISFYLNLLILLYILEKKYIGRLIDIIEPRKPKP